MKKLTSVFLVLMLVLALLPVGVLAQDGEVGTVAEESNTTLTTPVDTTEVKTEGEGEGEGELEETPKTEDEPKVEENKVEEELKTEEANKVEDEPKTEETEIAPVAEEVALEGETANVARIGDNEYTTLAAAIAEASGTTAVEITLLASVTEDVTIASGKNITLNLNGNNITNDSGDTITVASGATLTITGTGTVDNMTHAKAAIYNNGTVYLNGGNYTRSKENGESKESSGGNSYYNILNHGTMTISAGSVTQSGHFSSLVANGYYDYTGAKYKGERNQYIAGTNAANPTLTISGGTFSGGINTIKNDDGATLTINAGEFSNMTQHVVMNWNTATINGGEFSVIDSAQVALWNGFCDATYDKGGMAITGGTFTGGITNSNGTLTITGGTFTSDVSEYLAEGYVVDGDGHVTTLASLVANAEEDDTITLGSDVTLTETLVVDKDLTIDLNGHDITGNNVRAIHVQKGYLTLTGEGTVTTVAAASGTPVDADKSVIRVGDSGATEAAILELGENVTVTAPATYGITVFGDYFAQLIINGHVSSAVRAAIAGNGTNSLAKTDIVLDNEAVVETTGSNTYPAIYHPQDGVLEIWNATVNGGIEAKSGTVYLSEGATVTAKGTKAHAANTNDPSTTGYAVAIVENSAYKGGATCFVEGATVNGTIALLSDNEVPAAKEAYISILSGTFSEKPDDEYLDPMVSTLTNKDGKWVATVNPAVVSFIDEESVECETWYVDAAILAAKDGTTVKLLRDTTQNIEGTAAYDGDGNPVAKKVTLDLGGHTLTGNILVDGETTLTISGKGTLKGEFRVDRSSPKAKLVITGGTYSYDPSDYVSKDYVVTKNADGTWTVAAKAAPAPTAKPADAKKPPRTGDESNLTLWLALALLATCATVTTTVVAKKKNYNR